MLAQVFSATTYGLQAIRITVEVDIANRGLPGFQIVGLPSKAIDEARVRVIAAIKNSGFVMPQKKITVNLAPAHIKKDGSLFDLPIALCVLAADGTINRYQLEKYLFIGELSLNGNVMPVTGIVPMMLGAQKWGIEALFIPRANNNEARFVKNARVYAIQSLKQVVDHFRYGKKLDPVKEAEVSISSREHIDEHDFKYIKGQQQAKRALEIAAAGGHNVQLIGPPGTGKTMLASSIPSILPAMTQEEIIEVATIYSISRSTKAGEFVVIRPFRAPHHTISLIGMIGGGSVLKPGEISMAHRGVLFLDEFPEYPRSVIESLRQPLENREVVLSRASGGVRFPSNFMLIAASNPCMCGFLGHPTKECICTGADILRYQKKISGPIIDRIDIHVTVPSLTHDDISVVEASENSKTIRTRVQQARAIQLKRFRHLSIFTNSEMTSEHIRTLCNLQKDARALLREAFAKLSLSPRAYFVIIKLAQTIADLQGENAIKAAFVAEALQYRYPEQ
jgi:magnesium chelatase family protein